MKVALLADPHWGVRSDSPIFAQALERFLDGVFWPTIAKEKITHIICLGDVFDRRSSINTRTMNAFLAFLNKVSSRQLTLDIIIGNHDTFYNNTNNTNSVRPIVEGMDFVRLYEAPEVVSLPCGRPSLYIPWVCEETAERTLELIRDTSGRKDVPYVFGHLEIAGTPTGHGNTYETGFKRSTFKAFRRVLAGHIHLRSSIGNVDYIGAPTEHTWGDYQTPKGFAVLDTEKDVLVFYDNPETVHLAIDVEWDGDDDLLKDKIVKVVVPEDMKGTKRAKLLSNLQEKGMANLEVIESFNVEPEVQEIVQLPPDQRDVLALYIEKFVTGPVDKDKLKNLLDRTYNKVIQEQSK